MNASKDEDRWPPGYFVLGLAILVLILLVQVYLVAGPFPAFCLAMLSSAALMCWVGYQSFDDTRIRINYWHIPAQAGLIGAALWLGMIPYFDYSESVPAKLLIRVDSGEEPAERLWLTLRRNDGQLTSRVKTDRNGECVVDIDGETTTVVAVFRTWTSKVTFTGQPQPVFVGDRVYDIEAKILELPGESDSPDS